MLVIFSGKFNSQFSVDIVVWFLCLRFAVVLIVCAFFPGNLTAGFLLIELFGFFV